MYGVLLSRLAAAISKRNPKLGNALRPGMPEARVRRTLEKSGATGSVDPVVAFFSWKDGTRTDVGLTREQVSVFPKHYYIFLEFNTMLGHFRDYEEYASYYSRLKKIAGRYFPILWDGSNRHIAVDFDASSKSKIAIIDTQANDPVREA